MKRKPNSMLFSTNYQKVLRLLALHPGRELMASEVRDATGISKAGAHNALRDLATDNLARVQRKGQLSLFHVEPDDPIIRQVKVLINLLEIKDLVESLKEKSHKIVIFGSAASGMDAEDSDIDLFVVSDKPDLVRKLVEKHAGKRHFHLVIRRPLDYVASMKKNKIFYDEVSRGIVLYERMA